MNSYQGHPNISAGIFGRMGPGGGSLETGVNARSIARPSSVNLRPSNTPYTGNLLPNTAVNPPGATRVLKSSGRVGLLGGLVDALLNPVEDKIFETIDPFIGSLGRNSIPGMPSYYKSVNGVDYDIRTDAGMKAYKIHHTQALYRYEDDYAARLTMCQQLVG